MKPRENDWDVLKSSLEAPLISGAADLWYLKVMLDYRSTGLFTDQGSMLHRDGSPLSAQIWDDLTKLIREYEPVMEITEAPYRDPTAYIWDAIDQRGIEISKRISRELIGFPVYYFSNYRGDFLWPPNPRGHPPRS